MNLNLHQFVDKVPILLHGIILLVDTVFPVFQLYEQTFFVVLSAKHGLFAPPLHHGLNSFTVVLGSAGSTNKVVD